MSEIKTRASLVAIVLAGCLYGGDWQASGPFGGNVQSIAADPSHLGILVAGSRNGLLFRTVDGAKSWRRVFFGRALLGPVQALAIDPSDSHHYIAGISGEDVSSAGLWESHDDGDHWQQSLAGLPVESVGLWPKNPAVVVAGTRHGLYRRRDGEGWTRISPVQNPELQDITAVALDPADEQTIYAGTPHLPWKTTDGGATWHSIRGGMIDDSDVFSIAIDPAHPERIFASACSGIYRSESAGAGWKLLNGVPRTSRRTHIIAADPAQPEVLYAGTTSGLLKSVNGGTAWRQLSKLQINSIAFSPDSGTLFLATERSGVLMTRDGGETLIPVNEGLLTRNVGDLVVAGANAWMSTVYEGEQGGVFKFESGSGWRQVASPVVLGGGNVRALAAGDNLVYAATGSRLYRLLGTKWELVPTPGLTEIRALAFTSERDLLAGTARGLFLWDGTAWRTTDVAGHARLPVLAIYPSHGTVAIRTEFGVYVSRDGGRVWKEWLIPSDSGTVSDIVVCGSSALAATSRGLLRFSPLGSAPLNVIGIAEGTVSAVTFDPANCRTAYAAQFGVLYISRDEGSSWDVLLGGQAAIENLRVSSPARLYATFRNEGVFTLDLR